MLAVTAIFISCNSIPIYTQEEVDLKIKDTILLYQSRVFNELHDSCSFYTHQAIAARAVGDYMQFREDVGYQGGFYGAEKLVYP